MLEPYRGTLLPQALDLGLTNPILEDPRAINTKYFKPETWANHVKNHLGQQQFAKFVNVMAERIRMQTSKADEICAFAKLLGDEQEWNLLSVGVAALNESGVFNRMGPQVPQHSQISLLRHQIDEVVAARQEQIQRQLPVEQTVAVPYETRIHLREEQSLTCDLFSSSAGGTPSSKIERCKRSFEDFAQLEVPDIVLSPATPGKSTNGTPDRVAVIPFGEAPHIVTTTKPVNIHDIVNNIKASQRRGCTGCHHGYLTSDHPSYRPIELNSGRPRRPNPPDIPERIHLFDATGMPKPNSNHPMSFTPAYAVEETSPVQPRPRIARTVSGNTTQQQSHLMPPKQRGSSSSKTQPINTKSLKPRVSQHPPRSTRTPDRPQHIQQTLKHNSIQQSRPSVRFVEGAALTTVAEFSSDEAPREVPAIDIQKQQIASSVSIRRLDTDEEDDESADCPPNYLLVELDSKLADVEIGELIVSGIEKTAHGKGPKGV